MSTKGKESEAIRVEGLQHSFQKFKDDHIGIPNTSDAAYYTQAEADAYNALLTGALNSTDQLTAEEAAAYNAAVTGASKEAGDTLSSAEAAAYNATLEGAVSTSDIKTPAVPKKVKDYVDDGLSGKADLGNDGKVPSSQLPEIDTFPDQTGKSGKFLTTDGSDVSWAEVNMSAKADKLPMTGEGAATENNFMAIDANGNIKDSGKKESDFQAAITDNAIIGNGYAVCDTAGDTQQKEVSITDFLLIKNGVVSVKFTNGITVANPTLKINTNAAKAIYLNGIAVQPGWIPAGVTVNMRYNGAQFDIISMMGPEKTDDELLVDMGLPSGLLWATRNIDVTQANGFAKNIYQYKCSFFSCGNTDGHNPTAISSFAPYSWGNANTSEPYASSPGATLTGNISLGFDAAFANLGNQWRMPTTEEFAELFANIDYINPDGTVIKTTQANKLVKVNGVTGILLKSKNNSRTLFFPCSGYGGGQAWQYRGLHGGYLSNSLYSASHERILYFSSSSVNPQDASYRFYGFSVRPVQKWNITETGEKLNVRLTAIGTGSSQSDLIGASITITNEDESKVIYSTTWNGQDFRIIIPANINYSITVGAKSGYLTPVKRNYHSQPAGDVKAVVSYAISEGIYIADNNKTLYDESLWNYAITNGIITANKALGVAVFTSTQQFVIHPNTQSCVFNPNSLQPEGITKYQSQSALISHFDGKTATDEWAAAVSGNYAANIAKGYQFSDGRTGGYIPAGGQMKIIVDNSTAVFNLNSVIASQHSKSNTYWTSDYYGYHRDWGAVTHWATWSGNETFREFIANQSTYLLVIRDWNY